MIKFADTLSITFIFQKNKQKDITVTQPKSGNHICSVKIWSCIISRILHYKGTSKDTDVNAVLGEKILLYISRDEMMSHLQPTVNNMTGFGFTGEDVGTHSIKSSLAMALYLKRRPISTIMLLDRWSSYAFLLYIQRQVQEFSKGVSADMVNQEDFFTIPEIEDDDNFLDPRTRNPRSFANTISLNGPNTSTSHVERPAMYVWH